MQHAQENAWLTTEDLAAELQVSVKTVRAWRYTSVGPVGHRLGKHVRYARSDVEAWARANRDPERIPA